MIKIFTGDDRITAQKETKKFLGENYEVIDCADLTKKDLSSIFKGRTIFDTGTRHILLRDFTANTEISPELANYLDTPHDIVLLETKLDKRSATYKDLKGRVEIKEFKLSPEIDFRQVFDIYKVAKANGPKAIKMLRELEQTEDPIRFTGLLVSQVLKDYQMKQGTKEKQVLKALAKADLQMKSSKIDPWLIVESFLLNLSEI